MNPQVCGQLAFYKDGEYIGVFSTNGARKSGSMYTHKKELSAMLWPI